MFQGYWKNLWSNLHNFFSITLEFVVQRVKRRKDIENVANVDDKLKTEEVNKWFITISEWSI